MDKHHGKIIEFILRKNAYNISDLSKSLNINRRTLYNWFNQERIKKEIIFNIGCIIRHDFTPQFPELFSKNEFSVLNKATTKFPDDYDDLCWREKYLNLLPKYNDLLLKLNKVEPGLNLQLQFKIVV